ncbi:MAG: penicillin acylase family protein [Nocardioides sp.]
MANTMADQTESVSPDERSWRRTFRSWPGYARASVYAVVVLVLILVAGLVTGLMLTHRPLPQTTGELAVPGLADAVTVVRDEYGIPQLYGDSVEDLMRAQGYVHAQERFYEMDIRRHLTAGRLSEMFGEDQVETDAFLRTLGWREVAQREYDTQLDPATKKYLQAYSDGVNAYLKEHSGAALSVEYAALSFANDYSPEKWTPVDSVAWLKAMAWDLRGNMTDEIDRALTLADHTPAEVRQLYPPYPYADHAPIVRQGAVVDGVYEQDATGPRTRLPQRPAYPSGASEVLRDVHGLTDRMPAMLGRGDGIGSNAWAVDGDHSATGEPLLANDPHLGVSVPGIWMQMGLHCRAVSEECPLDVAGFTFSGVPGVVIGHNADIAWGFTNLGPDVSDLYLERVQGDRWRYDGGWRQLRRRTERIEVRDGDDVELTVRSTRHGPLLSDVSDDYAQVGQHAPVDHPQPRGEGYAVSLAWTGLQPAPTADAILRLDLATDWDSFRKAAARFDIPAQNLVYADREGHIGYQAPGRIPIRRSGNDGNLPAEGWRPDDDWTGDYVPFEALPNVFDPDEGFIVTANQAVVDTDYPFHLTDDWDRGYRSQRIRDVLLDEGELSVAEMEDLQLDNRNPIAPALTPYLLEIELPTSYWDDGQELLRGWDYSQDADSAAAAYFNVVWRTLLARTFHDDLPEEVWPDGGQRWMAVVSRLLTRPADPWWDDSTTDGEVETRDDILEDVLRDARDELTRLRSRDPGEWTWGHLHHLDLTNQTLGTSGIGLVEALVNRGPWEVGGGGSAVDATSWDAAEGYAVTAAPSMRMVVSLRDLDESRWINLTGVSGHPFSEHYTDQTDLWAEGQTLPWAFSADEVEAAGASTLNLVPDESE